MLGIGLWDWSTLSLYLVGITAIGVWTARKIHNTEDFFIGGRRFGKAFMVFFAFGAGTSGNDAVAVSSKTYTNGISGIWYQWLWLFATPFYWVVAPAFRRMRAVTTGDFFEYRYGRRTAALYALVGTLQLTVNMGVLLLGAGATMEAISGGAIPTRWAILTMTVLFVVYGIAGGLAAAIVTDFIQGILTIVLSFILLPFALNAIGGMAGLRAGIQDAGMLSLVAPGEINLFHIVIFAINALVGVVTQPHVMGNCAGGRTEMDGRIGFTGGNLLKRVCTIAWMLTGLAGVVYYAGVNIRPDLIYGTMAHDLLPAIMPGLIGLFLAALLASIMSSCDAFMVSSSGLFTQNVYRQFLVKNREDRHYVLVGRIMSVVIVFCSIFFASRFKSVPNALEWFFRIQAMMGPAFWLGLFWRRTTVAGAWAGTVTAFGLMFVTNQAFFHEWAAVHLPEFMMWGGQFRISWQMFAYLTAGFGVCILVSLLTRRADESKLERFYACLRTPVLRPEPHLAPFTLPPGVEPTPSRKLFPNTDIEIQRPSLVGTAGFVGVWLCVAGMIGFVYWLFS
ncbi:MAG TPA: sodium:solute symporter family protein [Candidatus Bathyarchaeia archaeon]|nr:sodium:solute symporter family protein [Candidatus Bathyarchaeia archaeon]